MLRLDAETERFCRDDARQQHVFAADLTPFQVRVSRSLPSAPNPCSKGAPAFMSKPEKEKVAENEGGRQRDGAPFLRGWQGWRMGLKMGRKGGV